MRLDQRPQVLGVVGQACGLSRRARPQPARPRRPSSPPRRRSPPPRGPARPPPSRRSPGRSELRGDPLEPLGRGPELVDAAALAHAVASAVRATAREHPVDESGGVGAAVALRQRDRLVDRDGDGNLLAVVDLEQRHPHDRALQRRDPLDRPAVQVRADRRVDLGQVGVDAKREVASERLRVGRAAHRGRSRRRRAGRSRRRHRGAGRIDSCSAGYAARKARSSSSYARET